MAWIPAAIGVATSIAGQIQGGKGAKSSARQAKAAGALNTETMRQQLESIQKLNDMADRLEAGEGISPAEKQFLDSTFEQSKRDITDAKVKTTESALDALASIGFLRSGRTARTVTRINIEAGKAFARASLDREQGRLLAIQRNRQNIINIRQGVSGSGARVQPVDFLSQQSIQGAGLTALGGQLISGAVELGKEERAERASAKEELPERTVFV